MELKRDMIVRGVLESVDDGLGITLSEVTFENLEARHYKCCTLFWRATMSALHEVCPIIKPPTGNSGSHHFALVFARDIHRSRLRIGLTPCTSCVNPTEGEGAAGVAARPWLRRPLCACAWVRKGRRLPPVLCGAASHAHKHQRLQLQQHTI